MPVCGTELRSNARQRRLRKLVLERIVQLSARSWDIRVTGRLFSDIVAMQPDGDGCAFCSSLQASNLIRYG